MEYTHELKVRIKDGVATHGITGIPISSLNEARGGDPHCMAPVAVSTSTSIAPDSTTDLSTGSSFHECSTFAGPHSSIIIDGDHQEECYSSSRHVGGRTDPTNRSGKKTADHVERAGYLQPAHTTSSDIPHVPHIHMPNNATTRVKGPRTHAQPTPTSPSNARDSDGGRRLE
ncbi:hypothetical protein BDY17DRAFT_313623 [Neohortaea acidophila]|uniref:Uncharacterized protein n=1 Tax=Neohortaea acidophila TaxID=245834 RepID=A0A6A6PGF7_9PEZI|nr:uncharacterized protein BDY17DRAFT_313623 [Neohortaea acidophila]KAF2479025.1 hypothetical protein BDY17DRAFT_313623 [Neohortaea acidophila]